MADLAHRCPDCSVETGTAHLSGCGIAQCLTSGGQRAVCQRGHVAPECAGTSDGSVTATCASEAGCLPHTCGQDVWTGRPPGAAEADEYGVDLTHLLRYGWWDQVEQRWWLLAHYDVTLPMVYASGIETLITVTLPAVSESHACDVGAALAYELLRATQRGLKLSGRPPSARRVLPYPESGPCPHCQDGHDAPESKPWGVYVAAERDGDGQPIRLHVLPANGSHVADSDAEWIRTLIRAGDRRHAAVITLKERQREQAELHRHRKAAGFDTLAREHAIRSRAFALAAQAVEEAFQL